MCSYREEPLLKTVTWKDATGLAGCYAFNAAQDGGQCQPCTTHMEQVGELSVSTLHMEQVSALLFRKRYQP